MILYQYILYKFMQIRRIKIDLSGIIYWSGRKMVEMESSILTDFLNAYRRLIIFVYRGDLWLAHIRRAMQ